MKHFFFNGCLSSIQEAGSVPGYDRTSYNRAPGTWGRNREMDVLGLDGLMVASMPSYFVVVSGRTEGS